MFPRVLYVDQDKALELDWFGFGALQTRNRYGAVRRAQHHQKHIFLEVVRHFQASGQPLHPSNPRCSRLMAEFANLLSEPPNSLVWRAMLQSDLREVARGFAEDNSPGNPPRGHDVAEEAAQDTQRFMTQASAALGGLPTAMLHDPFVVGSIASHTTMVLQHLTNGKCPPEIAAEAMVLAVQLTFLGKSVSKQDADQALRDHRGHKDFLQAAQAVTLILGARFGRPDSTSVPVREAQAKLRAMPRAFRDAFGSSEQERLASFLSQEHFVKPLKEKYGELWRRSDPPPKNSLPRVT